MLIPIIAVALKSRKLYLALIITITVIIGSLFHLYFVFHQSSSYCGLEFGNVQTIQIQLIEDSFITSKGQSIFKGQLIVVSGRNNIQCSAKGKILVICNDQYPQFYGGEVLNLICLIDKFSDSKEFSFIAFASAIPEHLRWTSPVFEFRKKMKEKMEQHMAVFPDKIFSLFNALFTGNDDFLDKDVKILFRKSGVSHLLALSGFHVSIIVLALTYVLKSFFGKGAAILISFPFLFFYLFLTGPSPSLLRAVIMYVSGGIFILKQKEISLFQILLLTSVIQLFLAPYQGFSLSYQLSYLALTGILILGKSLYFYIQPWIPCCIALPVTASIGAHILTAPVLIFYFQELYPIGIVSSLILTPLITLFMWFSLILFVLSFVLSSTIILNLSNLILNKLIDFTIGTADFFSSAPSIKFSSLSDLVIYLSIVTIVVLSLYIDRWRVHGRRTSPESEL
ncbi:MAG: ComEC/Rec2 family competence protein [Spirochaetaceae bacterium]|nr:ComEC/Rec2 family competence protein [Spirochaetaceae bacterium]